MFKYSAAIFTFIELNRGWIKTGEEKSVTGILKQFGLTDYEIKAYLTLVKYSLATADQISQSGGIPLPRVYDTLVELQRKGFVLISKDRPKKFKAISAEKALNNLIYLKKKDQESELTRLKDNIADISNEISKIETITDNDCEGEVWLAKKRKNVIENMQELENTVKRELLIFSGDFSWLPEVKSCIKGAIKRGVVVRALIGKTDSEEIAKNFELAKKLGVQVKAGYDGMIRGQIADNNIAYIATKASKKSMESGKGVPGNESESNYELLIFNTPPLVSALVENFDFWWDKL